MIDASLLRRTPLAMAASGSAVVAGLFLATVTQPRPSIAVSADVVQQVAFFAAVLGLQVAFVAGLRVLARVGARWHTPLSIADHDLIQRASVVFVAGLAVATGGWTIAVPMAMVGQPDASIPLLVAGIAVMNGATIIACIMACRRSGLAYDDGCSSPVAPGGGLVLGAPERVLRRMSRRPRVWCACVALLAALAAMSHAETRMRGSLMWGAIQAAAVIAGYVFLGPTLELRAPLSARPVAE